jgi:putative RNA methylase family UPF0020
LFVPPPGDYHRTHIALRGQEQVDEDRTLWLIADSGIGNKGENLAQRYLICFDQLLANWCPFQLFDENKPAWVAHTTIPHSLMRAMINLSLPWNEGEITICDPFVGTGTTWLETLKFTEAKASCSDLDPISPMLVADNLDFFSLDPEGLSWIGTDLEEISNSLRQSVLARLGENLELFPDWGDTLGRDDYRWTIDMLEKVFQDGKEHESGTLFPEAVVRELSEAPLQYRLLFYIGLRAELRYSGAFARASIDRETAFAQEARELATQIHKLASWKRRASKAIQKSGNLVVFPGDYSQVVSISPAYLAKAMSEDLIGTQVSVCNCEDLESEKFDILVADPPYGFNTEDESEDLAKLYHNVVYTLLRALKDGGQLVLCLPDRSHTGRRLPVCTCQLQREFP